MADTYIPAGNYGPELVPRIFSAQLMKRSIGDSFFIGKFAEKEFIRAGDGSLIGTDPSKPIQILRDLEKVNGDTIQYDLIADIKGDGVYGDDYIKGKEKSLSFLLDQVHIDQVRQGVDTGGRMTKKRSKHDLRLVARNGLSRWFARFFDEAIVSYLAGIRGEQEAQWVLPTSWNGFAGNPLQVNDSDHIFCLDSSGAVSNTISDAQEFTLRWLDKLETFISTMDNPINPVYVDGEPCYIVVLHPKAAEQLKEDAGVGGWVDIQKNAGVRGMDNPLFKDSLGRYGRFILHKFSKIPYKTISSDQFAYNLVLGAQSAVIAFGDAGGSFSFTWTEELEDRGNRLIVVASAIAGIKKCMFDSKAFSTILMPTKM